MKKALVSMSVASLLATTSITTQAQSENLIYVAVEPCRLVDTRPSEGGTGAIAANSSRDFLVSGNLTSQGGDTCVHPRAAAGVDPVAISAYIVAVPTATSGPGLLTAFPAGNPPLTDELATVNYAAQQVIGNTTNVTLCEDTASCTNGPLGIFTWVSEQNVVVDVQGYFYPATGTCPDDMVAVGSLCVDKYEASLVDASGAATTSAACLADGSNCADDSDAATPVNSPIFAQSVNTVLPANSASWFQAAIACANVGKRLPTAAEWQMAAAGTDGANCNTAGALALPGAAATCVSTAGAFDMVGNLWEWTADLTPDVTSGSTSAQTSVAAGFGESHSSLDPTPGTDSMFIPGSGAIATNNLFGFRCVR